MTMFYRFTFWYRHTLGVVEVGPAYARFEYNGQIASVDEADHGLATAIFTARMQARPIR
jgi:hypothetical protein